MKRTRPLERLMTVTVCCAAVALLAGACTDSKEGSPVAAGTQAPPESSSAPAASAPPSAPAPSSSAPATRPVPHPIDLRPVRPCSLFTPAVASLAQVGGDDPPMKTELPRMPHAPACFQFNGAHNLGLTLAVSPDNDLNGFDTSMGGAIDAFTVQGYPAVVIKPAMPAVCFAGVGMADHQLLFLQYAMANPISQPHIPQSRLCSTLRPIAQQVVSILTR